MILVFGSINVDLVARPERIPRPGETILAPEYERHFGGKGANQAVAAARMAGTSAVVFCGAIGTDAFGQDCLSNLSAEGIDITRVAQVEGNTGCAFISVDACGENAITVASGANRQADAAILDGASLAQACVVVMQMEVPFERNAELARRAAAGGAELVLNYAPARSDLDREALRAFLGAVDHLVVNDQEVKVLSEVLALPTRAPGALSADLALSVVVTRGGDGIDLFSPDGSKWHLPATKVDVVDTTGAGDTFVGVFAAFLAEGLPVRDAVRHAGRAASLSCTKAGAQGGMPRRRDLDLA